MIKIKKKTKILLSLLHVITLIKYIVYLINDNNVLGGNDKRNDKWFPNAHNIE